MSTSQKVNDVSSRMSQLLEAVLAFAAFADDDACYHRLLGLTAISAAPLSLIDTFKHHL